MEQSAAATAASSAAPAAIQASVGADLWPEPEWITRASALGWKWPSIAWRRAACVPGAWFDYAKADAIVDLWPKVFRLTEDRFAGQPFYLSLWQEITTRLLVGWKVPVEVVDPATQRTTFEHVRLFRRLMLWVPRKNGKSEFLACLALLFWALDGVVGGQGFVFARDEKQAKIVLDKMKAVIAQDARLAKSITPFGKSLFIAVTRSGFYLLSGKAEGKHGRSPTVSVGDEMHEWKSLELATTLRQGMGARLQPIELFASTAGLKSALVGYGLWEESGKILDGPIGPPQNDNDASAGIYEPSTLVVIFGADEDDDWRDEEVWRKANPNLGLSPTIDFLRREAALAKDNPRAESHFRRYHLNQWVESVTRWLPIKKWDACASDKNVWRERAERLKGRRCFGGFDVSSTQDITALVWWFLPENDAERIELVCRFWVPEDNIELRARRDRAPYDRWLRIGALEATPGDYVDQSYVQRAIAEGVEMFDVQKIGYDPWNAAKLIGDLQNDDGLPADLFLKVRQGIPSLGEATKDFERLVFAGLLDHGGHPVLRWMAQNALVRFDRNMNFAPDKEKSREKIDGVVAAVIADAARIAGEEPPGVGVIL
ncbi:terminase large subunit [Methylocystis iwaonis]|uniref:Terminase n=1 Tax=Methylocystis iwaonis TaxID=2885079 RepID=A0ABM8E7P8_9HYPH|nr:terminase TerL endonuclease subunit [Methylocystis iwaonis]BDV33935.1 terminase [Methylocystis iwaonis]